MGASGDASISPNVEIDLSSSPLPSSPFAPSTLLPREFKSFPSPAGLPLTPGLRWTTSQFPVDGVAAAVQGTAGHSFVRGGVATTYRTAVPGVPTSLSDSRLVNLSTRGRSASGANQMIVGFILDGNKTILVRAAGPSLGALGVANILPDPQLTLGAPASDLRRTNDNWQTGGGPTADLFSRLGAFPFASGSLDAALALSLGAQNHTALVSDISARSGIALVEAYDADAQPGLPDNPRLLNVSTRGETGAGENALIAGFVLSGTQPRRVLIRAIGPGLVPFGLSGTLADPMLTLLRDSERIATNDDWEISRSAAAIAATAQRVGAFPLTAASLDAALLITLPPGPYTVIVSGVSGGAGLALVEIYDAD